MIPAGAVRARASRRTLGPTRASRRALGLTLTLTVGLLAAGCGGSAAEPAALSPAASPTTAPTSTSRAASTSTSTTGSTAAATADPAADPPTIDPTIGPETSMPDSGATLASDLVETEAAIRDPAVGDEEAAAWGRHQQRLYHLLVDHPEWVDRVMAEAASEPKLQRAIGWNLEARIALEALVESERPHAELPAWRVVEPRPVDELLGYYHDGEARWGIDWTYLAAINLIETRMGRIEGLSSAGAVGPMQFLPTTWVGCCEGDPTDPADAIPGAARYLTIRGGPENMERAIWGYNNSDHYVAAVTAYAQIMAEDELAYRGYHAWEIFFRSTEGVVLIPVGYDEPEPVPAADWVRDHPESRIAD